MMPSPTFRSRLFLTLLLVSLVPAGLTLAAGTLILREVVVSTGRAGAWDQVGESGRELLALIRDAEGASPELLAAADAHEGQLAESLRMSRLYAFLAERVLVLLPLLALGLLALVAALSFLAAGRVARSLSLPLEELAAWTRALGAGADLPAPGGEGAPREIREFAMLRGTLRSAAEELRRARTRELEQARMRSWAEMARGVAHEIKNPLTPMRMAAHRVARAPDAGLSEAGEVLLEEIRRLDRLARTFSQFGRPPEGPVTRVDLTELLTSLGRRLSTPEVPIHLDLPENPVEVTGHLEALERVVRNLIANAQEAAAEGGEATADERPGPVEVVLRPGEDGVELRVRDRGPGIPEEVLHRIWDPEFTTKRRGTGLGLPMVRQAVRAHGGAVEAANREDGGGAEFRVRLPDAPPPRPDGEGTGPA